MVKENLLNLDFSRENELARVSGRLSLLSSYQNHWQGINLEVYRQPPFETPKCTVLQHLITIPQGRLSKIEEISEGKAQTVEFRPGDISFETKGIERQYRWMRGIETIHIILEPDYVHKTVHEIIDPTSVEMIPRFGKSDPFIYQLGRALVQELTSHPSSSSLYAESVATLLSVHLLRHYSIDKKPIPAYAGGLSSSKLQTAIDYIQAHLTDDISLEDIADCLGVSRYYFCRLFKQSVGVSPYQYILQQRVDYAKRLLREGKLSISEVALESGFAHHSHFNYHFKRLTQVTPKQYLKLQ